MSNNAGPEPDIDLLNAWRAGEKAAGEQLFDRHFNSLYSFFASKLPLNVEDLIQETFLACVEGRDRFRGDSSFRTYLFSIARHILYQGCRRLNRERKQIDFTMVSLHDLGLTPTGIILESEQQKILLRALRSIPLEHQIAIELYFWEEMSGPELARVLDIPEGTVRSRLRRGLDLLKRRMREVASSPELLESTIDNLDRWARSLRERLSGPATDA
jgi:RNA polymerase sigma-70 factor (ECF subfamily)